MIEKMVLNLVSQMESKRMIDKADSDQYEYAMVTLIEHTITVGTMLLIGLIFNQFIPTVCFLVFFLSLRKRTGDCGICNVVFGGTCDWHYRNCQSP